VIFYQICGIFFGMKIDGKFLIYGLILRLLADAWHMRSHLIFWEFEGQFSSLDW
jgi:hypothetical protein